MKDFESVTKEITSLVEDWEPMLSTLSDKIITDRRNSQNRTIKQIVGHLIDSTSNNTHRTIHLQYQQSSFILSNN